VKGPESDPDPSTWCTELNRPLLMNPPDRHTCKLEIGAPASTVYEALTTQQGLRGWWTADCDAGTGVGAQATFRFDGTFKVMRIERLLPDAEVCWKCVEAHIDAPGLLTRTDEWTGTSIVFRLVPRSPSETLLEFEHIGLVPQVECYEICTRGWQQFLASLKSYAETGKGAPHAKALS
jgi:uncharacterized protein YndB with AHSA1/START domain